MSRLNKSVIAIFVAICISTSIAYAGPTNIDPRYCGGEPKRNAAGKIVRSIAERKRFETLYPLPIQFKRKDWQVDHTIPLSEGGCDTVVNMQWLPKVIKTCTDVNCKDRWERKVYQK